MPTAPSFIQPAFVGLALLSGCTDRGETDDADGREEPWDYIEADADCEKVDDQPVPGATSRLLVEIEFTDGLDYDVSLRWVLTANDEWKRLGEDDCIITFFGSGTATKDVDFCSACAYAIAPTMNLDISLTDCPEGLWEDYEGEPVQDEFGVEVFDDGTAKYWKRPPTEFTDGFSEFAFAGDEWSWGLSAAQCKWF